MQGITVEYKESDEYKSWAQHIKAENPTLPEYLIDMAIAFHKMNPRAYKDKALTKEPRANPRTPQHITVEDAVKVYDAADAPPVQPIKVVDA